MSAAARRISYAAGLVLLMAGLAFTIAGILQFDRGHFTVLTPAGGILAATGAVFFIVAARPKVV